MTDAEKVPGWWESLSVHDRQRVWDLVDTRGNLPTDLVDSLRSARIYPAVAYYMTAPGSPPGLKVPRVVENYVRELSGRPEDDMPWM